MARKKPKSDFTNQRTSFLFPQNPLFVERFLFLPCRHEIRAATAPRDYESIHARKWGRGPKSRFDVDTREHRQRRTSPLLRAIDIFISNILYTIILQRELFVVAYPSQRASSWGRGETRVAESRCGSAAGQSRLLRPIRKAGMERAGVLGPVRHRHRESRQLAITRTSSSRTRPSGACHRMSHAWHRPDYSQPNAIQ